MKTELMTISSTPAELFVSGGLDPIIGRAQEKVKEFQAENLDVGLKKDRDRIRSFAAEISKMKTFIDKGRISFVKDKKASLKIIDQEGKKFRDAFDGMKKTARQPLTDWEEAEKIRVEKERQLEIFNLDYEEAIAENNIFDREKALAKKEAEFARIEEENRQKEEAARLEKEQKEREERLKKEAAEEATRAAAKLVEAEKAAALKKEVDAKAAIEKLERERIESIEREKNRKAEAERERIRAEKQAEIDKQAAIAKAKEDFERKAKAEKEKKDRAEAKAKAAAEAKAANKKHQAVIHNKILDGLKKIGVSGELGKKIIRAVATGKIKELTINY